MGVQPPADALYLSWGELDKAVERLAAELLAAEVIEVALLLDVLAGPPLALFLLFSDPSLASSVALSIAL
jgi:hypothetical protein